MTAKRGGLKSLAASLRKEVDAAVYDSARLVAAEAQRLITENSVSGAGHVPSKPGDPPNNDTGTLKSHIEAIHVEPLHAIASSNAPYAAVLEYGGSRMEPRPYMGPAAFLSRDDISKTIDAAVGRVVRKI